MNKKSLIRFSMVFCMLVLYSISPVYSSSKDDAKSMVMKAVEYYKANGKAKLLEESNKKDGIFVKGDVYVYTATMEGVCLSHPMLPNFVGKNFFNLKDADGKLFIKEAVDKLKTSNDCWINYKWNNPVTKKIGNKIGYFYKVGDFFITCGVWE